MEPTLRDGDEILVDAEDRHLREGIWVLRVDGVVLVKRLQREGAGFAVLSDNPEAGPVDLAGGYALIGRVLWAGRRL
jgi:phage repressor protein C with HTH and peptisase S24 domain